MSELATPFYTRAFRDPRLSIFHVLTTVYVIDNEHEYSAGSSGYGGSSGGYGGSSSEYGGSSSEYGGKSSGYGGSHESSEYGHKKEGFGDKIIDKAADLAKNKF